MKGEITRLKTNNAKYARFKLYSRAFLGILQSCQEGNILLKHWAPGATMQVCRVHWRKIFRFIFSEAKASTCFGLDFLRLGKGSKWHSKIFSGRVILLMTFLIVISSPRVVSPLELDIAARGLFLLLALALNGP